MTDAQGAQSFLTSGAAYDAFMGRYSNLLATSFADAAGVVGGQVVLDVGCGPGALTGVLVQRVGSASVCALDPSPPFAAECAARYVGVEVRLARAEEIPFDEAAFDCVLAQLVLHFVTDPLVAAREFRRVVRPGGVVAACVWDFSAGMEMLRHFWDAALAVDADAPDEAQTMRFGGPGEIAQLFERAGLVEVEESVLRVTSAYAGFEELWGGFMAGIGPAGSYCVALPQQLRDRVRQDLFVRVGEPEGAFSLSATARCARGRRPLASGPTPVTATRPLS